jgi:molecular chaperone GrpE
MSETTEKEIFDLEVEGETQDALKSRVQADPGKEQIAKISGSEGQEDGNGENLVSAAELLDQELAKLKSEVDKYKETALRSVADLDNYRKRMTREKEDAIRYANTGFLEKLIPILDNFELGLQAAKGNQPAKEGQSAIAGREQSAILDGLTMVLKQLQDFLSGAGVETIEATGQVFNPNLHEAIAQEESDEFAEGVVIRQMRKGYRLKDRLIRPAIVVVSKGRSAKGNSSNVGATS